VEGESDIGALVQEIQRPSRIFECRGLDHTRRLVEPGEELYRLTWELEYHNGEIRRQYEFWGDRIIQTLFARLKHRGIKILRILDSRGWQPILDLAVPEDAEVDILYDVSLTFCGGQVIVQRIYIFGFRGGLQPDHYLHFDPETMRVMRSNQRFI